MLRVSKKSKKTTADGLAAHEGKSEDDLLARACSRCPVCNVEMPCVWMVFND
jgi:hypothetical protein